MKTTKTTKTTTTSQDTPSDIPSVSEGLGRYLAIAFIAYQTGVSFETAKKRFGDGQLGPYWIALGDRVSTEVLESMNQRHEAIRRARQAREEEKK